MSIFGKKSEEEQSLGPKVPGKAGAPKYGIGDVIRLLRTLPVDQHADLVVRVIRTTLESVEVHVSDLIQDAAKQEEKLGQRIGVLRTEMSELTKQIETRRDEVSRLEADLAETQSAKGRLMFADQMAGGAGSPVGPSPSALRMPGLVSPPPPPARTKSNPPPSLGGPHHAARG
jgi:hypothetical protein